MRMAMVLIVAALGTTPVAAQTRYGPSAPSTGLPGISSTADATPTYRDTQRIRRDIRRGRATGTLSKRESRGLRREAGQIDTLAERYAADGLSEPEQRELDSRTRVLNDITNAKRTQGSARPR